MKYLRYPRASVQILDLNPRESAAQRGYGSDWQKARKQFLRLNPLCKDCAAESRVVPAMVVDHIIPHKGDQVLFWDQDNWQPLCKSHHSQKTARQDGGFGNQVKKNE